MHAAELKIGEVAIIEKIEHSNAQHKLMDMGCLPGEHIQLVFSAPLGDPIAVRVSGYTLSMRKAEAAAIKVKKL